MGREEMGRDRHISCSSLAGSGEWKYGAAIRGGSCVLEMGFTKACLEC